MIEILSKLIIDKQNQMCNNLNMKKLNIQQQNMRSLL